VITKRTFTNVVVFLVLSALLVFLGLTKFVFSGASGHQINAVFSDAQGLLQRDDVTMRGVPSGSVGDVTLNRDGTSTVQIDLDPGVSVPQGSIATITRRSPIGDLVIDITPGHGQAMADNATIPLEDTVQPPDPEKTIEALDRVFGAIPGRYLHTVVHQLSLALRNRGQDLATLSVAGHQLPERILKVQTQLESLIQNGPKVLDALAANAPTLADDITATADLATILKDRRFDLVSLSQHGSKFAQTATNLIVSEKPNLACLLGDFAHVNTVLARPQALHNLAGVLDLNHYFFGGVQTAVLQSTTNPYAWFRVFFLTPQQPAANEYAHHRPAPDVYGADACRSMYGNGIGPARQSQPPKLLSTSKLHLGH
jgi:phospholipid/cholesterol/gamma-HCH transport system substrate-binding protein